MPINISALADSVIFFAYVCVLFGVYGSIREEGQSIPRAALMALTWPMAVGFLIIRSFLSSLRPKSTPGQGDTSQTQTPTGD